MDALLKVSGEPKKLDEDTTPLYAGTISAGVAVEFVQFTAVYERLPSIESILNGTAPVPDELDLRWATISMVASRVSLDKRDEIEKLIAYIDNFEISLRVLFFRMVLPRLPLIRRDPLFAKAMASIQAFM